MKTCTKCGRLLDESMFYKNIRNKDGLAYDCKDCRKKYMNVDYAERNKERVKVYRSNLEVKQKISEDNKRYYQENKNKIKENSGKYYREHREHYKELNKKYTTENADYYKNYEKEYRARRRELWNENKLELNLHKSVIDSLKQNKPQYWCYSVLDFDYFQLVRHLESQFTPEMNWSNYGQVWELDHIIPKNQFSFNSYDDTDFKVCWSLINLRPILKSDNRSRPKDGSDIPEELKYKIFHQFDRKEENL